MNASKKAEELLNALEEHIEAQKELLESENERLLAQSRARALEVMSAESRNPTKTTANDVKQWIRRFGLRSRKWAKIAYGRVRSKARRWRRRSDDLANKSHSD